MKTRIRLARGTDSNISGLVETSVKGHPIVNTDKKYIYIGDGATAVNALTPISTDRIQGWGNYSNNTTPTYKVWGNSEGLFLGTSGTAGINFYTSASGDNNTRVCFINSSGLTLAEGKDLSTPSICGRNITDIFETNSSKVKLATISNYYETITKDLTGSQITLSNMSPSCLYKCSSSITNLTISSLTAPSTPNVVGEYFIKFTTGNSFTCTLSNITYANGWTNSNWSANTSYFIYIIDNIAFVSLV